MITHLHSSWYFDETASSNCVHHLFDLTRQYSLLLHWSTPETWINFSFFLLLSCRLSSSRSGISVIWNHVPLDTRGFRETFSLLRVLAFYHQEGQLNVRYQLPFEHIFGHARYQHTLPFFLVSLGELLRLRIIISGWVQLLVKFPGLRFFWCHRLGIYTIKTRPDQKYHLLLV